MNWGKGIIIAMALFMGFIVFLVVNIMLHRIDLESEDYYKKEINYEQEIIAMKNYNTLNERVELKSQEKFIVVQLPENLDLKNVEVRFTRPDDNKLDRVFKIEGTKSYLIPREELTLGNYNIEISFEHDLKPCLQKETITV